MGGLCEGGGAVRGSPHWGRGTCTSRVFAKRYTDLKIEGVDLSEIWNNENGYEDQNNLLPWPNMRSRKIEGYTVKYSQRSTSY